MLLAATAWWALDRADRVGNERRLSTVASQIAGREVGVRCPGPVGRVFGGDIVDKAPRSRAASSTRPIR